MTPHTYNYTHDAKILLELLVLVRLYRDNFRKLDVLFVAHILCWWWSAESMVVGKFCGKVVNLSDKKPCTEKRAEERGADGKCTCG